MILRIKRENFSGKFSFSNQASVRRVQMEAGCRARHGVSRRDEYRRGAIQTFPHCFFRRQHYLGNIRKNSDKEQFTF